MISTSPIGLIRKIFAGIFDIYSIHILSFFLSFPTWNGGKAKTSLTAAKS